MSLQSILKILNSRRNSIKKPYVSVGKNGCWNWLRSKGDKGYGSIQFRDKQYRAHQLFFLLSGFKTKPGLELDHLCRNRACCNPAHLEQVTHQVNCLRGESIWAKNRRKTVCKHGHALEGKNLRVHEGGRRECWECERVRSRIRGEARRKKRLEIC